MNKPINILYISEFDFRGSGYLSLSIGVCEELTKRGCAVTALGIGYRGDEHTFSFRLIPIKRAEFVQHIQAAVNNLLYAGLKFDHVVVALDVPWQLRLLDALQSTQLPYSGIFPLEAPPLTASWAAAMFRMKSVFVISKFGTQECLAQGLNARYLPVGVDTNMWHRPTKEERNNTRSMLGFTPEQKIVITVAANQERKNLGAALEIISKIVRYYPDMQYLMITDRSAVGWNLDDLKAEYGLSRNVQILGKGMPVEHVRNYTWAADAALYTSKAEGLGLPVLEAMACGLGVVAPDHTSFGEHIYDPYHLAAVEFKYRDPFGNGWRYFVDTSDAAKKLMNALEYPGTDEEREDRVTYVRNRTPGEAVDVLLEGLNE